MAEKFLLCILLAYFSIYIGMPICSAFNQDSHHELNKQIGSSLPCFEKYITESYFRHHKSLVDPNFREFVMHNVQDSENVCPRLLDLDRHLIGEGSHRSLSSLVKFSIQPDMISELNSQLCEFIIVERLPLGVFADPFELEHMLQQRVFNDVSVFGDINLELPSFLSNQSVVEVHLDIDLNKTSGQGIVQEFMIELPLHARYPHLDENGYSKVIFNIPDIFLRCKSREVSASQSCVLARLSGDPKLDPVVWLIPAGIKAHAGLVCLGTFASALLSAIMIIFVSLKQSRSVSSPILKQT